MASPLSRTSATASATLMDLGRAGVDREAHLAQQAAQHRGGIELVVPAMSVRASSMPTKPTSRPRRRNSWAISKCHRPAERPAEQPDRPARRDLLHRSRRSRRRSSAMVPGQPSGAEQRRLQPVQRDVLRHKLVQAGELPAAGRWPDARRTAAVANRRCAAAAPAPGCPPRRSVSPASTERDVGAPSGPPSGPPPADVDAELAPDRAAKRTSSSECPPRAKKSSSMLVTPRPSTSANSAHRPLLPAAVCGGRPAPADLRLRQRIPVQLAARGRAGIRVSAT